jgi:hypothetical protein
MRSPTILDLLHAVIEVAPSHPEVAVWWYRRGDVAGAPTIQLVLEARDSARPDAERIGSELARRLGPAAIAIRIHRGTGEVRTLYRLLTTEDGRVTSGHAEGS